MNTQVVTVAQAGEATEGKLIRINNLTVVSGTIPETGSGNVTVSDDGGVSTITLRIDGEEWRVAGVSWMDKEFSSSQLTEEQTGWDWFGLQLDDGRDLMVYRLRREDGSVDTDHATLVESDGTVHYLPSDAWDLSVRRRWRSDETQAEYPVRWRLRIPGHGLDLDIEARLDAQENVSRRTGGLFYWEGAVGVTSPGRPGPKGQTQSAMRPTWF